MNVRDITDKLTRELTDKGRIIEAGFVAMRLTAMHPDAPEDQVKEMRMAFFAGAQHLFGSLMSVMDSDREPTERDLKRMDLIHAELSGFIMDFTKAHLPTKGNA